MLGGHGRARSVLEHRDLPSSVGKGIPTGPCCGDGTVTHLGTPVLECSQGHWLWQCMEQGRGGTWGTWQGLHLSPSLASLSLGDRDNAGQKQGLGSL